MKRLSSDSTYQTTGNSKPLWMQGLSGQPSQKKSLLQRRISSNQFSLVDQSSLNSQSCCVDTNQDEVFNLQVEKKWGDASHNSSAKSKMLSPQFNLVNGKYDLPLVTDFLSEAKDPRERAILDFLVDNNVGPIDMGLFLAESRVYKAKQAQVSVEPVSTPMLQLNTGCFKPKRIMPDEEVADDSDEDLNER